MNWASDPRSRAARGQIYSLLVAALFAFAGSCVISDARSDGHKADPVLKVASELISLHDEYSNYLASGKRGVFKPTNLLVRVIDDRVVIDAVASGDANVLKADLESLGMREGVAFGRIVSGQLPILAIPRLEELPSLNFARASVARLHGRPQSLGPGKSDP